jgi:hypothetical protein
MKNIMALLIIYCLFLSCNQANYGKSNSITPIDSTKEQAFLLKEAYAKNNYIGFLKTFPNSFLQFNNLYGFNDTSGAKLLYNESEKHIKFFFNSVSTNESLFFDKLMNIAVEGKWEADAPSYFQFNLIQIILNQPNKIVELLKRRTLKEQNEFWFFVFDGSSSIHDIQLKELYHKIYQKVNLIDRKQGEIIKNKFEDMYKVEIK